MMNQPYEVIRIDIKTGAVTVLEGNLTRRHAEGRMMYFAQKLRWECAPTERITYRIER